MINRVDFQAQSFLQPLLQVWILRIDLTGHDAHRRAAVDAFQAIENRPQEGFPFLVPAHVVNGENDDRLNSFFADCLIVVMEKVAKILLARSEPLVIRGHTDRRPYRTATYDNWRLSAARAHMAYVMLARSGVDEKRFERIEGHADRSLRVAQDPEAAQNRRIEILLRKQTP